ncbi:DUF732 domain-containing protein [Nocardia seriolae]|uniref:DUF732 domain-containing protein n=3 Tax=Nocardia seriolae TaxID=37332 RepID=A0ABC8B1W7_9NOCA|nr:DUF732 domain-containing protein [Nocardia seriolae]APB00100.1 hypothetical protein NS506_06063 [Nocardia seriolae]MTJ64773.1 DUF732 domain-containing protein [Nocardia seriolae]MTJ72571.1 DUF732 domain-containing protein [Nocardia seriolae]MTJ89612.1 DUF732 domain-containing protein [Nocardia seriolae]MTK33586.1 DUF732 domain-containing protein [Nocardia seriolae]
MGKKSRLASGFGVMAAGVALLVGTATGVAGAERALTAQEQAFVSYLQAHGELLQDLDPQLAAIDVGKADCNALAAGITKEQLSEQLPGGAAEKEEAVLFLDAATAPGSLCG